MIADDRQFDAPEFLALLRDGNQGAYRRLIRRYHGSLVGIAQGIIGSRAQAEEVVQDAWLAVFRGVAKFEGRSSLASWIFTIVMNRARTRITVEGRTVGLPGLDGVERAVDTSNFQPDGHWQEMPALWDVLDPERLISGRQLWQHVQDAIDRLPAGQKAVILLRDVENRTSEEACELLSVSPENQRVLLHRARGRVRASIDALLVEGGGVKQASGGLRPHPPRAKPLEPDLSSGFVGEEGGIAWTFMKASRVTPSSPTNFLKRMVSRGFCLWRVWAEPTACLPSRHHPPTAAR